MHFFYDSKEFIKSPTINDFTIEEVKEIVKRTNVHLSLNFKKSINGKKSFVKTLGLEYDVLLKDHKKSEILSRKNSETKQN